VSKTARVCLVVAVAVVAGAIPAGVLSLSAGASTTACGTPCASPWNEQDGSGQELAVQGSGVGAGVVMDSASTTNSAEDWTPEVEGSVGNAVDDGILSAKLNLLYGSSSGGGGDEVMEFQYAPDGQPSDDCLADEYNPAATGNPPATGVVLAQCGFSAATLWIADDSSNGSEDGYVDLINAGYEETNDFLSETYTAPFAEPYVLTYSSGGVELAPLKEIGNVVSTSQMWADYTAPDQAAVLREKVDKRLR
jgi:hypothetical protein